MVGISSQQSAHSSGANTNTNTKGYPSSKQSHNNLKPPILLQPSALRSHGSSSNMSSLYNSYNYPYNTPPTTEQAPPNLLTLLNNGASAGNVTSNPLMAPSSNNNTLGMMEHSLPIVKTPYRMNATTFPPFYLDRLTKVKDEDKENLKRKPPPTTPSSAHFNTIDSNNPEIDPKILFAHAGDDDAFVNTFRQQHANGVVDWNQFLYSIKGRKTDEHVAEKLQQQYQIQQQHKRHSSGSKTPINEHSLSSSIINSQLNSTRESLNNNDLILKSYDLDTNWRGDMRLQKVFKPEGEKLADEKDLEEGNQFSKYKEYGDKKKREAFKTRARYWIQENREDWRTTLKESLMTNTYIPLFFRLFTLILSCIALGLSCRIFVLSNRLDSSNNISQQPSSIMAIVVQSVAVVYLLVVSHDEFNGQPIGLRDPKNKIRLILLDLFFIIFSSANLALSFNTLYDSRWVCAGSRINASGQMISSMCNKQKTLSAFLFIALVSWCVTFTISIFRVVLAVTHSK